MALPKLDRKPFFDPRSRQYSVSKTFDATPFVPKKRIWNLPTNFPLDQGAEGACVGFGWGAELATTPVRVPVSNEGARIIYQRAQHHDREMGNNWDEGASLLAGAKAVTEFGFVRRYHWAFNIQDVIETLVRKGPVVLGINWYSGMYHTEPNGLVRVFGDWVGGHCILANGFWPDHPQFGDVVVWTNSWGRGYGLNGRGYIRTSDLQRLLREDGEACIATDIRDSSEWKAHLVSLERDAQDG